jgi:zinc transport system substrate-binding protein
MLKRIIIPILLTFLAACSQKPHPENERVKPLILVSIPPYRFLAEQIAGTDFTIQTVVPVAADPHSFEPTAKQVHFLTEASVWFQIGEPFEAKISSILKEKKPDMTFQDLRDGIEMIEESPHLSCGSCGMDHLDRHIWLSPTLATQQAEMITKVLSEKFPEHKDLFEKNLLQLALQLTNLDKEIQTILEPLENRRILVSHPAFGYFCKDYSLEQISVEYDGKDPRPKHLSQILEKAVHKSMNVAIALPQHNNKGAQMIAEKLHIPVRYIDPYSPNYIENMKKLAHLIQNDNTN